MLVITRGYYQYGYTYPKGISSLPTPVISPMVLAWHSLYWSINTPEVDSIDVQLGEGEAGFDVPSGYD